MDWSSRLLANYGDYGAYALGRLGDDFGELLKKLWEDTTCLRFPEMPTTGLEPEAQRRLMALVPSGETPRDVVMRYLKIVSDWQRDVMPHVPSLLTQEGRGAAAPLLQQWRERWAWGDDAFPEEASMFGLLEEPRYTESWAQWLLCSNELILRLIGARQRLRNSQYGPSGRLLSKDGWEGYRASEELKSARAEESATFDLLERVLGTAEGAMACIRTIAALLHLV